MENIEALKLVVPNKVTNARYNYTEREENILTIIIAQLQKYMTQGHIQTDLFNNPVISININEMGEKAKKSDYYKSAKSLRAKLFSFEWNHPTEKNTIESEGYIVTTLHNYIDKNMFQLTLNTWAIPYLLYWGKGTGGTIFTKQIAIKLQGAYTKRLYKICKRFQDVGGFTMTIDQLRTMFMLENKYPLVSDIKKRILEPSILRMQKDADIYFKYKLHKVGGSRSFNSINFTLFPNDKNIKQNQKSDMYSLVYSVICLAFPSSVNNKSQLFTDYLSQDNERFEAVYRRFKKIYQDFIDGASLNQIIPLIKHILKNDFNLK